MTNTATTNAATTNPASINPAPTNPAPIYPSPKKDTLMTQTAPKPPSIHARAVITWLAIFPLVTLGFYAIEPFASEWNPVARALLLSLVVVPLAVYLVVPWLMRAYARLRRNTAAA